MMSDSLKYKFVHKKPVFVCDLLKDDEFHIDYSFVNGLKPHNQQKINNYHQNHQNHQNHRIELDDEELIHCGLKTLFYSACCEGQLDVAKWLFKKNEQEKIDDYVFYSACIKGQLEVAKWLYQMKPTIDFQHCYYFWTDIYSDHLHIIQMLCQINKNCLIDMNNLFYYACRLGCVKTIQYIYNNCNDEQKQTIVLKKNFYDACNFGDLEIAQCIYQIINEQVHKQVHNSIDVCENCDNCDNCNELIDFEKVFHITCSNIGEAICDEIRYNTEFTSKYDTYDTKTHTNELWEIAQWLLTIKPSIHTSCITCITQQMFDNACKTNKTFIAKWMYKCNPQLDITESAKILFMKWLLNS